MPLPFILGVAAIAAAAGGVASGVSGAVKMKEANDEMKSAQERHERNVDRYEKTQNRTTVKMDELGKLEMQILSSFTEFQDLFEKIKNRPEFKEKTSDGVTIPRYEPEDLRQASVGAGVILGGLGGAAVGTAGGFAAAGATTTAVMALGTASTGTAISTLSGAAATNATLAALGGGSLAAGGGGMALGSLVLGGATLGVGLLAAGVIFNVTGSKLSEKADEADLQMRRAERKINQICEYLNTLYDAAENYVAALTGLNQLYEKNLNMMRETIEIKGKTDWHYYNSEERLNVENTSFLVGLLFKMCQIQLVNKPEEDDELGTVNTDAVAGQIKEAEVLLLAMDEKIRRIKESMSPQAILNYIMEHCYQIVWDAVCKLEENPAFLRLHIYNKENRKLAVIKVMKADSSIQLRKFVNGIPQIYQAESAEDVMQLICG